MQEMLRKSKAISRLGKRPGRETQRGPKKFSGKSIFATFRELGRATWPGVPGDGAGELAGRSGGRGGFWSAAAILSLFRGPGPTYCGRRAKNDTNDTKPCILSDPGNGGSTAKFRSLRRGVRLLIHPCRPPGRGSPLFPDFPRFRPDFPIFPFRPHFGPDFRPRFSLIL